MKLGLEGKTVLVTGASRGIGRAISEVFADEGCRLCLAARNEAGLAELAAELSSRSGSSVETLAIDLAERGAAKRLHTRFPQVDILVNNAGNTPRGDLLQLDEEAWRLGWELKIFGYINVTRAYYADMVVRRSGVIINIIGMGAEKLDYTYAAGSTGNAALAAFTRTVGSMSLDLGVRVLGVNPGWTETDKAVASLRRRAQDAGDDPDAWRDMLVGWPAQRMIQPREIGEVVCFLASERASAMCGTVVAIDGGFGARAYPRAPR
ncbi:MAG: SDR family oxidoreductase [Rhodoferax sp.]|nr:SDR family oxidoreductase [Rhodoferax sp.]